MEDLRTNFNLWLGKHRPIVVTSTVLVSSLVVLGFVIIPQLLAYFVTEGEITEINNKTNSLEVKAAELSKVDSTEQQQNLQVVTTLLPVEPNVPSAITVLQAVVSKSGLLLEGVSYLPSPQTEKGNFQLSIKVSGTLQNIRSFILELKNAPRVFQIETISLHSSSGSRVEAEIPISVYYGKVSPKEVGGELSLSAEEQALLERLEKIVPKVSTASAQTQPASTGNIPTGRTDPFE